MRLKMLFVFFLFSNSLLAQSFFERIYPNLNLYGIGTMDISPSDNGFIFAGTQNDDYFLFRGDSIGNALWFRTYDSLNVPEFADGVCHLVNGNFAFIGSGEYDFGYDIAIVGLVDPLGNILGRTPYYLHDDGWASYGQAICTNPNAGYHIITYEDGFVNNNYSYFDNSIIFGFDQSVVRQNCLSVNPSNVAYACSFNNILNIPQLVGTTVVNNLGLTINVGQGLYTSCIQSDNDSGFVLGNSNYYAQIQKYTSSGFLQWSKTFTSNSSMAIADIEQNSQGKYFLLLSQAISGGDKIVLMATDQNGDSLWSRSFYGYGTASPINMKLYDNGDIVILGRTLNDPYIIKTDSLGQINPRYSIAGNGNFFCAGDTAVLTVLGGGASFLWSTGDTTQTIRLTNTTIASVQVTDSTGQSSGTGIYSVSFVSPPVAMISSLDTILSCTSFSMIDSATNHITTQYRWYLNDTLVSLYGSAYFNRSGMAKLVVTNSCGIDSDLVYINIPVLLPLVLSATPGTNFCEGDSILLSVNSSAGNLIWKNYQDTLLLNNFFGDSVFVKEAGIYRVSYIGTGGCLAPYSNSKSLINRTPDSIIQYNTPLSFCQGDSVVLFGLNNYHISTYVWSTADTAVSLSVKNPGCYSFFAYNSYGCSSISDTVCIAFANPIVNLGLDTVLCINSPLTLDAGTGYSSYLWQDSTNSQSISVSSSIADTVNYSVMVSNASNCSASDTIRIVYDLCNNVSANFESTELQIYPNPSSGNFRIYLPNQKNGKGVISILDLLGKEVRKILVSGKNNPDTIEVSRLEKGVYLVRYKGEFGEFTKTLIVD